VQDFPGLVVIKVFYSNSVDPEPYFLRFLYNKYSHALHADR